MESDVPLGPLLSGGIDSSLVSAAAHKELSMTDYERLMCTSRTIRMTKLPVAIETAKHIGSCHETLEVEDNQGTWDHVTALLLHAGQPFADTSIFAVNAVAQLMRRHVTVALSGDGGDEGFGGYDPYWQIARIARWRIARIGLAPRLSMVETFSRVRDRSRTSAVTGQGNCWRGRHNYNSRFILLGARPRTQSALPE
jgi:asparagine synthetase B (glutamine-hydrolysing)